MLARTVSPTAINYDTLDLEVRRLAGRHGAIRRTTDTARAFLAALEQCGYTLTADPTLDHTVDIAQLENVLAGFGGNRKWGHVRFRAGSTVPAYLDALTRLGYTASKSG